MNLIIDIGNTNVKAAIFNNANIVKEKTVNLGDLGNLIDYFLREFKISYIIVSSVSATKEELERLIDERVPWHWFESTNNLPINLEYTSKETLGTDRLAGIMGVFEEFPKKNVLVIDAGTCITYDLLTADHRYFGGSISPGLNMRYQAVNKFTKKLPLLNPIKKPKLIGQNTEEAIHSGIFNGTKFEIEGVINAYKEKFGNLIVIITGGDANNFATELKNTIFADQNLILKGLNKILKHHYQNA